MGQAPDVGVLLMHGIGTQSEGAQVRTWVDAVVPYLEAFDESGTAWVVECSADDDVLLRTLPLGADGARRKQRWLVAEAWWADAFDVPDRGEVSRWLRDIGSWFVYLFVVRLWRRFSVRSAHVLLGLAFAPRIPIATANVADLEIHYADGSRGRLIYGKCVVTERELSREAGEYGLGRVGRRRFPADSTVDQWLDEEQFDASVDLGRSVGEQAVNNGLQ